MVKSLHKSVDLDCFDYLSLERYFEELLELLTEGSAIYMKHNCPFPDNVVSVDKGDLFDSKVGKVLLDILNNMVL